MSTYKLLVLVLLTVVVPAAAVVNLGEQAPNFTLVDHTGTSFTLAEKLGSPILLFFMGYT